jgi:hypothetical protein
MKIYHIIPTKSRIKWSGRVGDRTITGKINACEGSLISELGQVIGGNISVDLTSIKVTDNTLTEEDRKHLEKHLKSLSMSDFREKLVQYKIDRVFPQDDADLIKGLFTIGNQAFGVDVKAKFHQDSDVLSARGSTQVEKSNPELLRQIDISFQDQLKDDKSIEAFEVEFDLNAMVE